MRALTGCRGLTIIELLIAMAILSVALATIFGMTTFVTREWIFTQGQTDVQQQLRVLVDRMTRDLRRATNLRIKTISLVPDVECPGASAGTQCLLLESTTVVAANAGTAAGPSQQICVERIEGIVAGAVLSLISPGKDENATVSCTGGACSGPLTCPAGSTKVGFAALLKYARQTGELVASPLVRYEFEATGQQVLRDGVVIAESIGTLNYTRPESVLASATPMGAKTISVVSAGGFAVDDVIGIGRYDPASLCGAPYQTITEDKEIRRVTAISGTTLTLDRALLTCHASGRPVRTQVVRVDAEASRAAEGTSGQVVQTSRLSVRARLRN
jgi:prepilin-type N-terminal cleavage/methylation domain-containing protein